MSCENKRIPWIDELRGLAILAMIAHHLAFNFIYFLEYDAPWLKMLMESTAFHILQMTFVAVFMGLSGICCHLTRHPFKRALRVFSGALAVTLVTCIVYPADAIYFGILHCLSVLMALYAFLKPYADRVPRLAGVLIAAVLFFTTFRIPYGFALWQKLPESLYVGGLLTPVGFPAPSFESLDYVPLLPHLFLFAAGVFLGNGVLPAGKLRSRFLAFCGRHSLAIYLLHQPLVFALFFVLKVLLQKGNIL